MEIYVAEWLEQDGGGFSHANLTLEGAQRVAGEQNPDLENCVWYGPGSLGQEPSWSSDEDVFGGFYRIRLVEVGP